MNDPIRNQYYARLGITTPERSSVHGPQSVPASAEGLEQAEGAASPRTSMASVRATLPAAPQPLDSAAEEVKHPSEIDLNRVQEGLESANKVGVKAAKLAFWGKLAGTLVTGLGLLAFGFFTGGAGPLAIAGLTLMGTYFLKACGDVYLAGLQLKNARALANGSTEPPHKLPCGADSLGHLLLYPMRAWCQRNVKENDTAGRAKAEQVAIGRAKVTSMIMELSLGIAATAITGASYHMMAESLGFLAGRLLADFSAMMLMREPSKEHELASIEQAKGDLQFVSDQLDNLKLDPPEPGAPEEQTFHYQNQLSELSSLKQRFAMVRDGFMVKLKIFEEGLKGSHAENHQELQAAKMGIANVSLNVAQTAVFVEAQRQIPLVTMAAVGHAAYHAKTAWAQANRQEKLMERFTKACVDMNRNLKTLSAEAVDFKTALGMPPVAWPVAES